MNSNKLAVIALISTTAALDPDPADLTYDYTLHGSDWDLDYPGCGNSNQSPINLITVDRTASQFEYRVYDQAEDAVEKIYWNQAQSSVLWTGDTTKVIVNNDDNGLSAFNSDLGTSIFNAEGIHHADHFVFHAGSEHTINGERLDLEMQTIHIPDPEQEPLDPPSEFLYAGVAILFSNTSATADLTPAEVEIIDTFFQSLQWDNDLSADPVENPVADLVTYGNLMELVDFDNRWAYKGSGTTPPCASYVYWNVLSTVYPIKEEDLTNFKQQLARGQDGQLDDLGNWRETQDIDNHNVIYVSSAGKWSQKITNMFKGASSYLSVGAAISAIVAATI